MSALSCHPGESRYDNNERETALLPGGVVLREFGFFLGGFRFG